MLNESNVTTLQNQGGKGKKKPEGHDCFSSLQFQTYSGTDITDGWTLYITPVWQTQD